MAFSITDLFRRTRKAVAHDIVFVPGNPTDLEDEEPEFFTQEELEDMENEQYAKQVDYYYEDDFDHEVEFIKVNKKINISGMKLMNQFTEQVIFDQTVGSHITPGGFYGCGTF
ncbi:hypothetical protein [Photorhabdus sp. SF281]|uniref:hypothetical protein n=1 Tax=Photorhabdus sp. SF281 TaxID=3459527 RepID=UPI004043D3F3